MFRVLFPKLKIHGYNNGFATNSSSSHSVVIDRDNIIKPFFETNDYDTRVKYYFGWDDFILKDKNTKFKYLMCQIYQNLDFLKNELHKKILLEKMLNIETYFTEIYNISIDHNSIWNIPIENINDFSFYRELKNFILRDDVAIVGGNDNDSTLEDDLMEQGINFNHPLSSLFPYSNPKNLRCKKDNDYWIFFDIKYGTKVRFSFNDNAPKYEKSEVPELVDLNITDFCDKGCKFCYKDSTQKGKHASLNDIETIYNALKEIGVFEIAIGGGEPTKHPDFTYIISLGQYEDTINKPIINFSTYSTDWLNDKEIVRQVKKCVGGIGVSVHNVNDIINILKPITKKINDKNYQCNSYMGYNFDLNKNCYITAQHAFGSVSYNEFIKILKKCIKHDIPLLLLGYKTTGRGNDYNPIKYNHRELTNIFKLIRESYGLTLSIDTLFANKYKKYLDKMEIPECRYSIQEGRFSCYIDAVNKTMSPSSFDTNIKDEFEIGDDEDENNILKETILENYSKY